MSTLKDNKVNEPVSIEFSLVESTQSKLIANIASWYFDEWRILEETTVNSLTETDGNVIFQILMTVNNEPVATGGLYRRVGIQSHVKKYQSNEPWIALMYSDPQFRGQGYGSQLLAQIEIEARARKFDPIYLFTHTAETLYRRNQWSVIERVTLNTKDIVIMNKTLSNKE